MWSSQRQARVLRELSQRALPDPEEHTAGQPAPIDTRVQHRRREFAATETAALRRGRDHAAAGRPAEAHSMTGTVGDKGAA
ncbi:hypothetical protein Sspor_05800 [Streptomyces spororaveus]|uniref:Uncharacterized protein n=1 Tax=Streptomyces spororaveus TaxID=284039 RepID=A0ABQ3T3Q6_9ACTN|nr:hypothetical protein Sspor_05800 [Streptomyces spororaveus]